MPCIKVTSYHFSWDVPSDSDAMQAWELEEVQLFDLTAVLLLDLMWEQVAAKYFHAGSMLFLNGLGC